MKSLNNVVQFKPIIDHSRWNINIELEMLNVWEQEGLYRFIQQPEKPLYSIDTPPPYTTNKFHVGASAHYTQQDMIARYKSLCGYNVLFPFGLDRNGQPVEVIVERNNNILAKEIPREEFIRLCKEYLDKIEHEMIEQAKRLGMSSKFENIYRTDSSEYRATTQGTFIDLWKRNLIYESGKPVNYCSRCGTSLADADVWYEELPTILVFIDFTVDETNEKVTVATTRPELLTSCSLVIYNPDDERYAKLNGKTVIVPIYNKKVKVVAHPAAELAFGTGLVMICSYGDYSDVRLFRELKLQPTQAIDNTGKMTKEAGKYKELYVKKAREQIINDLENLKLIRKKES